MALYGRNTLKALQHGVDTLTPFTAGAIRGVTGSVDIDRIPLPDKKDFYNSRATSAVPEPYATAYKDAAARNAIMYTVLSYSTPIAWRTLDGEWTVPVVTYSVTTTAHQSRVAAAIGSYLTIPAR